MLSYSSTVRRNGRDRTSHCCSNKVQCATKIQLRDIAILTVLLLKIYNRIVSPREREKGNLNRTMMTNSHVQAGAAFNHGLPSIRSIAVPKLPFHRGSGPDESLTLSNFQNKIPAAKSTRPRFFKMTEDKHKKVDVVIIGAGAAGLQTASNLLASSNFNGVTTERPSFLILEGRNRVGGRICTAVESKTKLGGNEKVSFPRDLGAAWVHGTGLGDEDVEDQNPMIKLLEKTTPEGQSVLEYHLNPIFQGNCWTRPDTVLHKAGRIALFRKGERIRNDSPLVKVSIERHYQIEKEIAKRGSQLYEIGQELLTAMTPVAQVRSRVSKLLEAEEKEDSSLVGDLVPFYAFLSKYRVPPAVSVIVSSISFLPS